MDHVECVIFRWHYIRPGPHTVCHRSSVIYVQKQFRMNQSYKLLKYTHCNAASIRELMLMRTWIDAKEKWSLLIDSNKYSTMQHWMGIIWNCLWPIQLDWSFSFEQMGNNQTAPQCKCTHLLIKCFFFFSYYYYFIKGLSKHIECVMRATVPSKYSKQEVSINCIRD